MTFNNQLRDYQTDLLDRASQSWDSGNRSVILQLPPGAGKTVCFSHMVADATIKGKKALILAHREELIKQAADKITAIAGIEPGIIKAGYKADYSRSMVIKAHHLFGIQSVAPSSVPNSMPNTPNCTA